MKYGVVDEIEFCYFGFGCIDMDGTGPKVEPYDKAKREGSCAESEDYWDDEPEDVPAARLSWDGIECVVELVIGGGRKGRVSSIKEGFFSWGHCLDGPVK